MIVIYKYKTIIYNDEDEFVGEKLAKFIPEQLVYIVKQKRRKIIVTQARIDYISCLGVVGRSTFDYLYRYYIYNSREVYWDDSKTIFDNKEDAYEYAEKLDRRRNIKFKNIS